MKSSNRRGRYFWVLVQGIGLLFATQSCNKNNAGKTSGDGGTDQTVSQDGGPFPLCSPTGGGPFWIEEGNFLTVSIKCATGLAVMDDAFALSGLPRGAVYDTTTETLTWTPELDQAGVYFVIITAQQLGETGEIKIGVADKFDDPDNILIKDSTTYTEEFGLPVFHILQTSPTLDDNYEEILNQSWEEEENPCNQPCGPSLFLPITIVYRGHTYNAEAHYRGHTTLEYPKKGIALRFAKDDKFNEPVFAEGRMKERRAVLLLTTFDDKSYLRWRMAFELWNRMDPQIIRIEHFSAVVYVDGQYRGLFTVSDKIDDNMMERAGLAETGNVYFGWNHNADFEELADGSLRFRECFFEGFIKKEGLPDQCTEGVFTTAAFDDLKPLLDFVVTADDAAFGNQVGQVVDVENYIDWFVHTTAISAEDSFAKNASHYHDPDGGLWRVVPWDFHGSFGQGWNTARLSFEGEDPEETATTSRFSNRIWKRLWNDAAYGPSMRARYAAALADELKQDDVLALFESLLDEIDESAKRDERKWGEEYKTYDGFESTSATYASEIPYMREWIQARWEYLAEEAAANW